MIELLNKASTTPLQAQTRKQISSSALSFKDHMDQSLSPQSSLRDENIKTKITAQKKKITEISEQVNRALENENLKSEEKKELTNLQEMLSFMEQLIQEIEQLDQDQTEHLLAEDSELSKLLGVMDQVLRQGFSIEKGEYTQLSSMQKQSLETIVNIMKHSFQDIQQFVNTPNFKDQKALQVLVAEMEFLIEPIVWDNVESLEAMLTETDFIDTELSDDESQLLVQNNGNDGLDIDTIKQDLGGFSQQNSHKESGQESIVIKDNRTTQKSSEFTVTKAFTLETMDAESSIQNIVNNTTMPTEVTGIAKNTQIQNLYSSFSPAVARVQVEAMIQNLSGRMAMVVTDGGSELRMKLTPPELGQMKLFLTTEDNIMHGKIVVETAEAKMLFEQNINNLKESLAQMGMSLGNIDIDLGSGSDFSEQFANKNSKTDTDLKQYNSSSREEVSAIQKKSLTLDNIVDFMA